MVIIISFCNLFIMKKFFLITLFFGSIFGQVSEYHQSLTTHWDTVEKSQMIYSQMNDSPYLSLSTSTPPFYSNQSWRYEPSSYWHNSDKRDFYDFLKGTKYIQVNTIGDSWQKAASRESDMSERDRKAVKNMSKAIKAYLSAIGFDVVRFDFEGEDDKTSFFDMGAKSSCDIGAFQLFTKDVSLNSAGKLRLENVRTQFTDCNANQWSFSTKDRYTRWGNESKVDQLFLKALALTFWQYVPKDDNYRVSLHNVTYSDGGRIVFPNTGWTKNKTKEYFINNDIDNIEGIYEQIAEKGQNKYTIAVIKSNEEEKYNIIYLDGAKNTDDWIEGDLKGEIFKTATPNLYKVHWSMIYKFWNEDALGFIDELSMLNIELDPTNSDPSRYLKLFPIKSSNEKRNPSTGDFVNSGTGFAISKDGFIVTNYHVIDSANMIVLESSDITDKQRYSAEVVISDEKNDLAILKINDENFSSFDRIPYTFKTNLSEMGTKVYTLGYPLINSMGESVKLTDGLISSQRGFKGDISSYQVSIPVQPGNSGGPLFDYKGNLIGIINAKHIGAENAAYAIKSNYLQNLIELLPNKIYINQYNRLNNYSLSEQVTMIDDFIFLIKTK